MPGARAPRPALVSYWPASVPATLRVQAPVGRQARAEGDRAGMREGRAGEGVTGRDAGQYDKVDAGPYGNGEAGQYENGKPDSTRLETGVGETNSLAQAEIVEKSAAQTTTPST